ncbi:MAG: hypothetical protein ACR2NR_19350 [Solirubrobacteraceae bacterium]
MSASGAKAFRTVAFGEVEGGLWGAAVDAGADGIVGLALGSAAGRATVAGDALQWSEDGRGWCLTGDGVQLRVQPRGQPPAEADGEAAESEVSGLQELCHVHGMVSIAGAECPVDCAGTRTEVDGMQPGSIASARGVSGFFEGDEALTLLALRSRRAAEHNADLVAATLFDPDRWLPVADPRLSTTYTGAGEPSRTSLELWVGDGESEFPRRAAGESAGPVAALSAGELALRVTPLRCHSRGLEGAGVYVLARF